MTTTERNEAIDKAILILRQEMKEADLRKDKNKLTIKK